MGAKTRKLGNINNSLIEWQAVHVADGSTSLAAVSGRGYFIDTTSGTQTITLPTSPAIGDTIMIVDYASTFNTNNVTVDPGSNKIEASTTDATLSTNDQTHTLVFTDSTQGWKIVNQDTATSIQPLYTSATGGTVTTSGDFKIHSFTGDGCFVVSLAGNPTGGGSAVDYLVVAGGGSGGVRSPGNANAGGGAGGMRFSASTYCAGGPAAPRAASCGLTISAQTYPITVGGGGAGVAPQNPGAYGNDGSNSVFSTITSTGGGGGGHGSAPAPGRPGGSGGGGGGGQPSPGAPGGNGNTPPVSPSQGSPGGVGGNTSPDQAAAGGGGMMSAGTSATPGGSGQGEGGNGGGIPTAFGSVGTCVCGVRYLSAGGGAGNSPDYSTGATGGFGSGAGGHGSGAPTPLGNPAPTDTAKSGVANSGGGGGGAGAGAGHPFPSGSGGKGIVVIRYKFQN